MLQARLYHIPPALLMPSASRYRREEVPAAVPVGVGLAAHQAQVGLVDQGGRLQRLAGPFVGQLLGRQLAQLLVDQREELFRRARRPARWRTGSG